jgi:hypothetical protein
MQSIEKLGHDLAAAYTTLKAATQNLQEAAEETIACKRGLTIAEQRIINEHADDPKRLGGNKEAREAAIAEMTADHRLEVERAEDDERKAKNALDLAKLDLEAARVQLRVLELVAGDRREVTAC